MTNKATNIGVAALIVVVLVAVVVEYLVRMRQQERNVALVRSLLFYSCQRENFHRPAHEVLVICQGVHSAQPRLAKPDFI